MIPVLLIMTSNAPDTTYLDKMKNYQQALTMFVGPTELFISGDTLQLRDYSKTDWSWYFDGEAKLKRHETVFPQKCRWVYEMGSTLVNNPSKDSPVSVINWFRGVFSFMPGLPCRPSW